MGSEQGGGGENLPRGLRLLITASQPPPPPAKGYSCLSSLNHIFYIVDPLHNQSPHHPEAEPNGKCGEVSIRVLRYVLASFCTK